MIVRKIEDCYLDTTGSGCKVNWIVDKTDDSKVFEMRRITIDVGMATNYGHHPYEHGVFVLSGEGLIKGKDCEYEVKPETCSFIPGGEEHQFINTSKTEPFVFICTIPAGSEDSYKVR